MFWIELLLVAATALLLWKRYGGDSSLPSAIRKGTTASWKWLGESGKKAGHGTDHDDHGHGKSHSSGSSSGGKWKIIALCVCATAIVLAAKFGIWKDLPGSDNAWVVMFWEWMAREWGTILFILFLAFVAWLICDVIGKKKGWIFLTMLIALAVMTIDWKHWTWSTDRSMTTLPHLASIAPPVPVMQRDPTPTCLHANKCLLASWTDDRTNRVHVPQGYDICIDPALHMSSPAKVEATYWGYGSDGMNITFDPSHGTAAMTDVVFHRLDHAVEKVEYWFVPLHTDCGM